MTLQEIVHSEAQRGKRLVEAHFGTALRHVNEFVNETTLHVSTPGDIVSDLQHRDFITKTTVEVVDVDRTDPSMSQWTEAHKAKHTAVMRRVTEIIYKETSPGTYRAKSYK